MFLTFQKTGSVMLPGKVIRMFIADVGDVCSLRVDAQHRE